MKLRPGGPAAALLFSSCLLSGFAVSSLAQTATTLAPAPATTPAPTADTSAAAAPAQPSSWFSSLKLGAQLEGGATINPSSPSDGLNFGQLFTDKANQALLNQIL